jgi:hypothetical protein
MKTTLRSDLGSKLMLAKETVQNLTVKTGVNAGSHGTTKGPYKTHSCFRPTLGECLTTC